MEQRSAVEQDLVLPVSPEELWAELTDPEEVGCWFGATVEWDLVPGGRASFHDDDGTERAGVIDTVDPMRELRFRWWGPDEPASEVQYRLEEVDGGTRLTVIEQEVPAEIPAKAPDEDAGPVPPLGPPQASAQAVHAAAWGTRAAGLWLACHQPVLA